jgi:hypothetical protein
LQALIDWIEPQYPKATQKGSRPLEPLARMLPIYLLLQWFFLSDPAMERALLEMPLLSCCMAIRRSSTATQATRALLRNLRWRAN